MVPNIQAVDDLQQLGAVELDPFEAKWWRQFLHESFQLVSPHIMRALWVKLSPRAQEIRDISAFEGEYV